MDAILPVDCENLVLAVNVKGF